MTDVEEFRQQKDEFFRAHHESPLTPEQKRNFQGLRYYPEDPSLRFVTALDTDVPHERITIPTSTGDSEALHRAGRFTVEIDGQPVTVTAYGDPHEGELFIP